MMETNNEIWIVIPVFNRWELTKACLESLILQSYPHKIVVVDHGSTDRTSINIASQFPNVIVLKGDESMWWAAATNLGVRHAVENGADFILSLNNDLIVPRDYLDNLMLTYKIYSPCLVGSVSVDISNSTYVNYCGSGWNRFTAKYQSYSRMFGNSYEKLQSFFTTPGFIQSDFLPGRGVLIPAEVIKKIGYYDDKNFPHYAADEDFALRAKEAGYKIGVGVSCVVHSHLTETGMHANSVRSFKEMKRAFVSIKSPMCLKIRYRWAVKHSPLKGLYFLIDMARLTVSLLK